MKKILLIFICFLSCEKVDCDGIAEYYRQMDENFLIIDKMPLNHGREVNFKIRKNNSQEITNYCEENTWFAWHFDKFEKGDRVIKKKGEIEFSIHKKDTVLHFSFECDGKIYK